MRHGDQQLGKKPQRQEWSPLKHAASSMLLMARGYVVWNDMGLDSLESEPNSELDYECKKLLGTLN